MVDLTAAGDTAAGVEEWLYYLKDALGSVMALVSLDTGQVVECYAYDPYGRTEEEKRRKRRRKREEEKGTLGNAIKLSRFSAFFQAFS